MREFAEIVTNPLAVVHPRKGVQAMVELILVLREPVYRNDGEGGIYRAEAVETVRVCVSPEVLRRLGEKFGEIADQAEKDLAKALAVTDAGKEPASDA